jgi:hypothetical protein
MRIPTLSVRQPWASLLVTGVKRFEVRTWGPKDTGLILIHASSGKAPGIRELRQEPLFREALLKAGSTDEKAWMQSAFVGLVDIVRVITPEDDVPDDLTELDEFLGGDSPDYLWEVGNHWTFPTPVPSDGKLNLWTPPTDLIPALNEQLRHVNAGVRLS